MDDLLIKVAPIVKQLAQVDVIYPALFELQSLLDISNNPELLLTNIKNLLELEFKSPEKVITLLAKHAQPTLQDHVLYLRKCLVGLADVDMGFKNLIQMMDCGLGEKFLMHFSYGLSYITDKDHFVDQLRKAIQYNNGLGWEDVFTQGQMRSKQWLVTELYKVRPNIGTVFIEGGWIGSLSYMMAQQFEFTKIRSFDIDPICARAADLINMRNLEKEWRFKASTRDMLEASYEGGPYETVKGNGDKLTLTDIPDTIINTSSEHLDFQAWFDRIPKGKLVVLQNNNFFEGKHHVNCHATLDEFAAKLEFTELLFKGTLKLELYDRYMLIGIK